VAIHHLLTHTSGIPSYTDDMKRMEEVVLDPYPSAEFVAKYCSGDLQFEPGSRFRYDNSGYFILGAVIEAVTGKPYEEVLRERILAPLGIKNTGYDRPVPVLANRASGYTVTFDGFENARHMNMSLPFAAGALYSTVEDLYLWDRALAGDRLLSPEAKAVLFKPHVAIGGGTSHAYGWMVRQRPVPGSQAKTCSLFHGGVIFGFRSYIERLPDKGRLVVILSNTPEADVGALAGGIIDILYGEKPPLQEVRDPRDLRDLDRQGCGGRDQAIPQNQNCEAGRLRFRPARAESARLSLAGNQEDDGGGHRDLQAQRRGIPQLC
jgi:CubicO group peptidase (beta-lactamase class C family)